MPFPFIFKPAAARSVMRQHHLPSTARQGTTRPQPSGSVAFHLAWTCLILANHVGESWVSRNVFVDSTLCLKPFEANCQSVRAGGCVEHWNSFLWAVPRQDFKSWDFQSDCYMPKCAVISASLLDRSWRMYFCRRGLQPPQSLCWRRGSYIFSGSNLGDAL